MFFKRGEHVHSNVVGRDGSHSLILEVRSDDNRARGRNLPLPDESFWTRDPNVMYLAACVAREFRSEDAAANLAREGVVLELIASLLRSRIANHPDASRPPWLSRVEDMLHDGFHGTLGLSDVAAVVGRHPAHVARTFRRHHGCSLGEYLRRIRLERAARALRESDRLMSEIALDAGFYDQAHFGRCFRAWTSVSPKAYRSAFRS